DTRHGNTDRGSREIAELDRPLTVPGFGNMPFLFQGVEIILDGPQGFKTEMPRNFPLGRGKPVFFCEIFNEFQDKLLFWSEVHEKRINRKFSVSQEVRQTPALRGSPAPKNPRWGWVPTV